MKFTLSGFEVFLNNINSSIFADIQLPTGADADIIKGVIIEKYGEMETLYADPFHMKFVTSLFFKKHSKTFEKWYSAINMDYEPLYNYDRYEQWSDEGVGSKNSNSAADNDTIENGNSANNSVASGSNTRSSQANSSENSNEALNHNGINSSNSSMGIDETTIEATDSSKISNGNTQRNTATDDTNKVSAYNSSTMPDAEKDITQGYESSANSGIENGTINGTSARSGNNTNASSNADISEDSKYSASSKAENETITDASEGSDSSNIAHSNARKDSGTSSASESSASIGTHTGHIYGNIGVTTSSALLKEFLDVSAWSFYDHVADLYAEELLLMVY